jgi:DNA-binding NtrC family response regulator
MTPLAILVVECDASVRRHVKALLLAQGYSVLEASEPREVLRVLRRKVPDLIIINAALPAAHAGIALAQRLRQQHARVPIIQLTANSSEALAIAALRAGVNDYLKLPCVPEELIASVRRLLSRVCRQAPSGTGDTIASGSIADRCLIGDSAPMRQIKAYISKVAATDSHVLVTGETGTGKELVAELIQRNSPRRRKPFVCINCAAIPDTLLESELFGYEKGAFTGANTTSEGKLKLADGGSIFFDEIGDMSLYAQAKILRAIESREVFRLGGQRRIALNVRVIAATNQDLEQLVARGQFRKDLYFRLNVVHIHLPPLRERREDIVPLCHHYLRQFNEHFGRHITGFTAEALACLLRHDWPGNVRELKNLLEAAFVKDPAQQIAVTDLPEAFRRHFTAPDSAPSDERQRLLSALFATNWNVSKAAQQLHWSRMTLYRKLEKYHIVKGGPREAPGTHAARDPLSHLHARCDGDVTP